MKSNYAKMSGRDELKFHDRNGVPNLVARIRATRQGQVAYGGPAMGTDGSKWHVIRKGADSVLYCDCPAWRFSKADADGVKRPCKHVRAALVHMAAVLNGTADAVTTDVIIYRQF